MSCQLCNIATTFATYKTFKLTVNYDWWKGACWVPWNKLLLSVGIWCLLASWTFCNSIFCMLGSILFFCTWLYILFACICNKPEILCELSLTLGSVSLFLNVWIDRNYLKIYGFMSRTALLKWNNTIYMTGFLMSHTLINDQTTNMCTSSTLLAILLLD